MTGTLRTILLMALTALLLACAGAEIKQPADDVSQADSSYKNTSNSSYVDVDADVESDFNKAIELLQQQQYQQAVVVLNSVTQREQRLPAPYVNIAIAYNHLGDSKAAEDNLISALKIDIGHPVANNELGLLYRRAGKFNAARTAYENAIRAHPEFLPVKINLGVLCDLYLHDFQCALQQFEDYLELQPDDKTVAIWVADVKRRVDK